MSGLVAVTVLAACVSATELPQQSAEKLQPKDAKSLFEEVLGCGARVWRGARFGESRIAFVDSSDWSIQVFQAGSWREPAEEERAHVREYHEGTYSSLPQGSEPLLTLETSAEKISSHMGQDARLVLSGLECLGVSHPDAYWQKLVRYQATPEAIVGLAFHEYMHPYTQASWPYRRPADASRSTDADGLEVRKYQLAIEAHLFGAVIAASPAEESAHLARARKLSAAFEQAYPEAFRGIGGQTIQEGTAQYIDLIASRLAEKSCSLSDARLLANAIEKLQELRPVHIAIGMVDGYLMGAEVSILLERHRVEGWQEKAEAETASLLRLLELIDTPASADSEPDELPTALAECLQAAAQE